MLRIGWEPPEIPDFDPEIHNPEKVFAFLCYTIFVGRNMGVTE